MFDGLKKKVAVSVLSGALRSLATSKDTHTTITGLVAAAILAAEVDIARLIDGSPAEIAKLVSAVIVFFIGLIATRENADGKATALGAVAGALQMMTGQVDAIINGVLIALIGYLTNKPVIPGKGK